MQKQRENKKKKPLTPAQQENHNALAAQRFCGRLHQHWSSLCRAKKKTKNGDQEKRHGREEKRGGQKGSGSTKNERETNARKGEESEREQGQRGDREKIIE